MKTSSIKRGIFRHVTREAETPAEAREILDGLSGGVDRALVHSRELAEAVLKRERIFDLGGAIRRKQEFDPDVEAALDVMFWAKALEDHQQAGRHSDALVAAIHLGNKWSTLAAAIRWRERNPPPSAAVAIQTKKKSRIDALAAFIGSHGERPQTRQGKWYAAFREAHPEHPVTDRTLKADYPHAVAALRKRT